MYWRSSESRMRSGTWRRVLKWSRHKDRYIGRLYSDIGKVPSDLGIFRSTRELREYGEEVLGLMGQVVEERRQGARPALGSPSLFPVWPNKAQYFSRRIPVTLRYSEKYPNHSEPFRSPNIVVQYINFYVSTISRLLIISPISSGTPNYFGTSKLNKTVIVTLSVRTLRVRELCRHDRDTSPVNNQ